MTSKRATPTLVPTLPRDLCQCGHVGNGPNSQHDLSWYGFQRYAEGHGPCLVAGCPCKQFTWDRRLTPAEQRDYLRALARHTRRAQ